MKSHIILGRILQRFEDRKMTQVENHNKFEFIKHDNKAVYVTREKGKDTKIPLDKIVIAITAYLNNPELYDEGPSKLREVGITHITSPIWSLLHLLDKKQYI